MRLTRSVPSGAHVLRHHYARCAPRGGDGRKRPAPAGTDASTTRRSGSMWSPIPGTFGVETDLLMRDSHALVGLAYAAASLVGGFGSLWVGIWAARPFSQTQRGATS